MPLEILILILAWFGPATQVEGESAEQRFFRAFFVEVAERKVKEPLSIYQSLLDEFSQRADLRARVRMRIAACELKLGNRTGAASFVELALGVRGISGELDGLSVCRQIRDHYPRLPIIMISARGTEEEKVMGLETGADDYVAKPFGVQEILARVRALLRRSHPGAVDVTCAEIGDATIDFLKQELRRGEECMKIGSYECRILQHMLARRGQVVTREELLRDVWGVSGPRPGDRTVDNYVAKLRRKVERDPRRPRHIITIHGSGYRFLP